MISRYEACMDGVALSSLDPAVHVLDIRPGQPAIVGASSPRGAGDGLYITNRHIEKTTVSIDFEIHEYSTWKRQEICQRVAQWAKSGILTTSDRPDQMLRCICDAPPAVQSAKYWTDPVTVTLAAYAIPYWQNRYPSTAQITSSGYLFVPGNLDSVPVDVTAVSSSALTSLTLTVGSTSITLSGINISANTQIKVTHDENNLIVIKSGNTSLLNKRTGDDDLLAACGGRVAVSCSANAAVTCTFSTKGGWY